MNPESELPSEVVAASPGFAPPEPAAPARIAASSGTLSGSELGDGAPAVRQRLALLAEAGLILARSLDYETTLAEIARLAVPTFADWCIVDVVEAGRSIRRVAVAAAQPGKQALLLELQRLYPTDWDAPQPAAQALRGGRSLLFAHLADDASLAPLCRDAGHRQLLQQLGPRSVLAVPLFARSQVIGAITFALAESGRLYTADDLTLAEDLARRCALAMDNARLYQAAHAEIAERKRAEEALGRVRRELEERIQERTLELARANQALVAEITRQRRTEEALRTSERRARALLEHGWEGVSLIDSDGTVLYTSPPVLRALGYSPDEMEGRAAFDLLHADDIERAQRAFRALCQSPGASTTLEYRHRHKDGSWRWIEAVGSNRLDDPDVRAVVVNHRDITERKQGAAALRRSEGLYRDVVEGSLQGLAVQQDGTLRYVNPALTRIFGYDHPDEIIGRGWEALVAPEDVPILLARSKAGLRGDPVRTLRIWQGIRKDGSRLWAESGMAIIAWHGRPAVLSFVLDVTERVKAEQDRRESEERFRVFMATCPLIAFMKDADGRHVYVNPAFERIFGMEPGAWKGKTEFDLFPEATARQLRANDIAILASGEPLSIEETVSLPDGVRHYISFKFPFRNASGEQFLAGMAMDVTERRQMEEQLRQAQKMEAIGRLAGGVAHDFNNLLTGILGYGDMLLHDIGAQHPSHELVVEMQKAAERATQLNRQLLAFSRKQVLTLRVIDVNAVIADMEPMLRRLLGEEVQLLTLAEAEPAFIKADDGQLQQVIVNLSVNARDAMPRGGTLVLHTSSIKRTEAGLGLTPGPYVLMTVSDTGCGMTDEVRAHLFEPFFTTKERGQGSGLGLCTSYGIVKQFGGAIDVDTAPGTGTTFRIYLPRVPAEAAPEPQPRPLPGPRRGTETVLLVEDEDIVRALFLKVLKQQGYTVLPATCGEDALLQMERYTGPLHLLATDVVMPGISGRELAERLTAVRPGLKVLFLSGYTDDAVLRHGVREAETAFLQKPFTPNVLARKVREVLDGTAGSPDRTDVAGPPTG